MCSPATCPRCQKVTWFGCGEHVEAVMAGVPSERRCTCFAVPANLRVSLSAQRGRSTAVGGGSR